MTLDLEPALPQDADALADLRLLAMRPSLERVGRFDAQRARQRLLQGFDAAHTRHVVCNGVRVGVVVARDEGDAVRLDHLYVHPDHQGRGIGARVLAAVVADAAARRRPVRLSALRDSPANDFYRARGFVLESESEWDLHYVRAP